jgi:hypothetical protein
MKRLITPNHVLLPCTWLDTLISIFPDATPPSWQILGTLGARQHWARLETIHTNNNKLVVVVIIIIIFISLLFM